MKVPKGRGLWPAFWINPEDQRWPPEIDVVEIVDNGELATQKSFHFLHGVGATQRHAPTVSLLDSEGAYAAPADYSQAYHVFSVEWTSTRVRHLVDGVPVADREFRWIHDDGKDAGMAHVLVNLAVGGKWTGPPRDAAEFPSKLSIDYIRVWQK
jgi:beta-glucanase (GH16 family)